MDNRQEYRVLLSAWKSYKCALYTNRIVGSRINDLVTLDSDESDQTYQSNLTVVVGKYVFLSVFFGLDVWLLMSPSFFVVKVITS